MEVELYVKHTTLQHRSYNISSMKCLPPSSQYALKPLIDTDDRYLTFLKVITLGKLNADRPYPHDYPHTPTNYKHIDNTLDW